MTRNQSIIKKTLQAHQIDGAIMFSPENFHYTIGVASHQHTVSRNPMMACAVVTAQPEKKHAVICMDYEYPAMIDALHDVDIFKYDTWVGMRAYSDIHDKIDSATDTIMKSSIDMLQQVLQERNLLHKKVGIEMNFVPISLYRILMERFPYIEFVDIGDVLLSLRSIKDKAEVHIIRELARVSDEALNYTKDFVQVGITEQYLADIYRKYVVNHEFLPSSWSMFSTGSNCSKLMLPSQRKIRDGDSVKFDGGVHAEFDFYTTDNARTWLIGDADPVLVELKQTLYEALQRMIYAIKPELPINKLFTIGFDFVKKRYPTYKRGHLGHSISLGPQTAEAPMITATETRLLAQGMVLCVEVPCYIQGVGGFNLEDMVLVTSNGCEVLTYRTPHFLCDEKRHG